MAIPARVLLLVSVALACIVSARGGTHQSFGRLLDCLEKFVPALSTLTGKCATQAWLAQGREIMRVKCRNCDRYHRCKANRRAMQCGDEPNRDKDLARKLATVVSDCAELFLSGGEDSPKEGYAASLFGRNGGNCTEAYLKKVQCPYDPKKRTCGR